MSGEEWEREMPGRREHSDEDGDGSLSFSVCVSGDRKSSLRLASYRRVLWPVIVVDALKKDGPRPMKLSTNKSIV